MSSNLETRGFFYFFFWQQIQLQAKNKGVARKVLYSLLQGSHAMALKSWFHSKKDFGFQLGAFWPNIGKQADPIIGWLGKTFEVEETSKFEPLGSRR